MKFISLSSSSEGNCIFVSYLNTNILIDLGISFKNLVDNLSKIGHTIDDIDFVLITHEHSDHTKGLPMFYKYSKAILISQKHTLLSIKNQFDKTDKVFPIDLCRVIYPLNGMNESSGEIINLKDIKVIPFFCSHDVPCVFYKFILGNKKIAIVTDLGTYDEYTIRNLLDVNYMMLECNYDTEKLISCSNYTYDLKKRIMSDKGHLSNTQCAELIIKLLNDNLKIVALSHISKNSNDEEFAYNYTINFIKNNYKDNKTLPKIFSTHRKEITEIFND